VRDLIFRDFAGSGDAMRANNAELTEILAKDHRQNRTHKRFIELDI
jgi:hypothetical protein